VKSAHARSNTEPETLRLSVDTKAKVKMGLFSRGGRLRCSEPIKALDHDMESDGILVPFGILEVKQKQFNVVYGNSLETSDFIVDSLSYRFSKMAPAPDRIVFQRSWGCDFGQRSRRHRL
jgi:hypothetical protein